MSRKWVGAIQPLSAGSSAVWLQRGERKEERVERPAPEQIQTLQKGREEEEGALDTGYQVCG